ncbi:MAG: hypothetical protein FWH07_00890 [Oscillospiraceae bacterium]|nr:hypothetical protein [Oscillospiraceae bacterium]
MGKIMKLALAAFGVATLVGVGYIIGKKVMEKKKSEEDYYEFDETGDSGEFVSSEHTDEDGGPDVGVYAKEKYGDKIRKASLFAVGAIKTGADKLGETFNDIKTKDMVKKGEQTFEAVKETGGNIKNDIKRDIEDLKSMVSSIEDEVQESQLFEKAENTAREVTDEVKDIFGEGNK